MDWSDFGWKVAEALTPILVAVVTVLVGYAMRWLAAKTSSAQLSSFLLTTGEVVNSAVREVEQTLVQKLKEGRADGKLTDAEKADALKAALDKAKMLLGSKGIGLAQAAAGLGKDELDAYLKSRIESAVWSLRTN